MCALHVFLIFILAVTAKFTAAINCNGLPELCDLRIDQATFPGSHNAGSGFDGVLKYWSGVPAASCSYRNHDKSFTEQLDFGIRYFDVDTCYGQNEALNCHCSGGGTCAYTGSIEKSLLQIDTWMKSHPHEIVVIHFNNNAQEGHRDKIAKSLEKLLPKLWQPNNSGKLAMNNQYNPNRRWPTLGDAVRRNQRIFVFMDNNLSQYISPYYDWLVTSNGIIASSWDSNAVSSSCSGITANAKRKCYPYADFIELSAFGSYGLCNWDMATICSKWLGEAQEECFKRRKTTGKTVNFLLVDWLDYYSGQESVINKAKFMNQKNVKEYLGKNIFFPELTGCSHNDDWSGKYCYKYCSKYGRCWINQYCGDNPDVCKQQDYPCDSTCT